MRLRFLRTFRRRASQGTPSVALFATCGGSIPPDHNENSTAVAVLFCVGDPSGRIVQVISLREITCCSCGEALLSPNVPPTISQRLPSIALFATCGGSIPSDLNTKSTAVAVLFVLVTPRHWYPSRPYRKPKRSLQAYRQTVRLCNKR